MITAKTRKSLMAFGALALLALLVWRLLGTFDSGEKKSAENPDDAQPVEASAAELADAVVLGAPSETPARVIPRATDTNATIGVESAPFNLQADTALSETNVIQRSMNFGRAMREWVAADPAGAADYLRNMPRGNEFVSGLLTLIQSVAETDPRQAVKLAVELAVNPGEMHVFNVLFDQIAQKNVLLATSLLELLDTDESLDNSVRAIASRWVDTDEKAALAWANRLRDPTKKSAAIEAVLFPLVESDPWRALSIAAKQLNGDALERTITRFLAEVTVENTGSAEDVLNFLPNGETRSHAIYGIARELAETNPRMALSWASQIEEEDLRRTSLRNVMEKWYAQEPDAARAYAAGSLRGAEQIEAVSRIAEFWGANDPAAAAAWAQELPSLEARDAAVVFLVSGWARKDPPAAAKWAMSLPESERSRGEAIDGALSFWALIDAPGAADYAESLPPGLNRDTCLDALADLLAVSQPDRAASMALQIADGDLRKAAVLNVAEIIRPRDSGKADELMRTLTGTDQ